MGKAVLAVVEIVVGAAIDYFSGGTLSPIGNMFIAYDASALYEATHPLP